MLKRARDELRQIYGLNGFAMVLQRLCNDRAMVLKGFLQWLCDGLASVVQRFCNGSERFWQRFRDVFTMVLLQFCNGFVMLLRWF